MTYKNLDECSNTFPEIGIKGLSRLYHNLWTGISNMSMLR
jgi:hypothetical protein